MPSAFAAVLVVISLSGTGQQTPTILETFQTVEACLKKAEQMNNPPTAPFVDKLYKYPNGYVAGGKFAFCLQPIYPV